MIVEIVVWDNKNSIHILILVDYFYIISALLYSLKHINEINQNITNALCKLFIFSNLVQNLGLIFADFCQYILVQILDLIISINSLHNYNSNFG